MSTNVKTRKIVLIDEDKCNGCGECVPSCAEGAIKIIDGKARLLAENLCDGLGNCLGECPRDAITIEERPADAFDEQAVEEHLAKESSPAEGDGGTLPCGCPGSMEQTLAPEKSECQSACCDSAVGKPVESKLGRFPIELMLLSDQGPIWNEADVLLAADCVGFCMPDFHERLLDGKNLAIACPKLDDAEFYVEKLSRIFAQNEIKSLTAAMMEVPCCGGLEIIVREAMKKSGKSIPLTTIIVGLKGEIQQINGVKVGG